MIIKGMAKMQKHLDDEYEKNLTEWYAHRGKTRRVRSSYDDEYSFDEELEVTGYQAPGAAAGYWDIPNM